MYATSVSYVGIHSLKCSRNEGKLSLMQLTSVYMYITSVSNVRYQCLHVHYTVFQGYIYLFILNRHGKYVLYINIQMYKPHPRVDSALLTCNFDGVYEFCWLFKLLVLTYSNKSHRSRINSIVLSSSRSTVYVRCGDRWQTDG